MTAMRIIAPVGLSLFSNYKHKGNDSEWSRNYETVKDRNERACKYKNESRIATLKKGIEKFLKSDNACAEISSILKIAEKFPENEFSVTLLPSDTVLSLLAAELIKDSKMLENRCSRTKEVSVEPFIPGLQVDDEQEFIQKGMSNLIQTITDFKNKEQDNLVINITGGYKATIPYLTIMGQIYNIPLYYTFEETSAASPQLIRIPQAPIYINYGLFEKYANIFRELDAGVYDWEQFRKKYCSETDELLVHSCVEIFQIDGKEVAELSPIGKMFWKHYNDFYSVKVLAGSNYFTEKDKTNINKAIRELCQRLDTLFSGKKISEFESHFLGLHDTDLKHVRIGKNNLSQVYKHSNPQIRLHYIIEFSETGSALKIINFRHRKDNSDYAAEFNNDYQSITYNEYTTVAIKKK